MRFPRISAWPVDEWADARDRLQGQDEKPVGLEAAIAIQGSVAGTSFLGASLGDSISQMSGQIPRARHVTKHNHVPERACGNVLPLNIPVVLEADQMPYQAGLYPEFRYMGSKSRLLPWIHQVLNSIDFETALDPFSGTGCVAYLIKAMGRRVIAADFLNFSSVIARATIENSRYRLDNQVIEQLIDTKLPKDRFIEKNFTGIFYTSDDLQFLDRVSGNIRRLKSPHEQALALAALFRSCLKRQPRGVFTVSGDLARYDDGRRDLRLSLEEHFLEQIEVFNMAVFDNGRRNSALRANVFELPRRRWDLVYLDPPYVPRADDNCYIKRYHFLEGLSCYWQGLPIDTTTKVRKIAKRFTPFSYRRTAVDAFDRMFARFSKSTIVLSYSSNGYPDLTQLEMLMGRHKRSISVFEKAHRYHFGTHGAVNRAAVTEYLLVGS